jgi:hypothetical protein
MTRYHDPVFRHVHEKGKGPDRCQWTLSLALPILNILIPKRGQFLVSVWLNLRSDSPKTQRLWLAFRTRITSGQRVFHFIPKFGGKLQTPARHCDISHWRSM